LTIAECGTRNAELSSVFIPHSEFRIPNCELPMSEAELQNVLAAPEPPAEEPAPVKAELSPDAALELLRAGKTVENALVKRLKFRGPVEHPVRFRNCTLTQC